MRSRTRTLRRPFQARTEAIPRLTSGERQSFEDLLREYAKRRHKTQAEVERDLVAGEDGSTADFGELARDCVCFANSAGGTLLIGIEDDDDAPAAWSIRDGVGGQKRPSTNPQTETHQG